MPAGTGRGRPIIYPRRDVVERYGGGNNPIVTVADQAAARVPGRPRAPLMTSRPQRPVRRALRVKTVEALPRPMSAETYAALLGVLRTRRDRALLELMWEGGLRPGEALGCGWKTCRELGISAGITAKC
ncbi:hypothetical protein ACTMS0_28835 [Micromonospora sp. H33]|uniref:hypothetical protein n=1 Tax=Micromonospora sp. H33 TaxID=3452215 RepID=UPI003F892490